MIVKNINSRNKGHQFERDLCKLFRKYFPKVNTSRASSKLLDDCKIDLNNIDFNIQAKNGYDKTNFNFFDLKNESEKLLKKNFEGVFLNHYLEKPFLLIHKKKVGTSVTIELDSFMKLIEKAYG
jgi:hypothetical protein